MVERRNLFNEDIISLVFASFFIFGAAIFRILPHPSNFTPIIGIALFGGVYFSRKTALIIPISAMLVSDFFIGFYNPILMAFVYIPFIITVIFGSWVKNHKEWYNVIGASFISSILFFIISNFGFWLFSGFYPKTLLGLISCYIAAIPFFKNTLLSALFYTVVLFGSYELLDNQIKRLLVKERLKNY